ncbi:Aldo/keto reductase [Niveomyces insectorum RCEF 264]|uniref:Aldo/keto reductase n=1 Tax=Niveomyces insectorum RCEF 264 TaxID=1081102 RepID=A0A162MQL5_9HYPO|nr:Aldo/keto reductase [Niveomyces insectorum RCEF 264]
MTKMQYRKLGRTGLKVSAISLGSWLTYGGHVADDSNVRTLKAAFDAGINFFDTAEGYEAGKAETLLGQAIKDFGWKRQDLVVSTKIFFGAGDTTPNAVFTLSRKHVVEGLLASLKRLQLDYVDIVYAHRHDAETPMEEIVRAFNHVIDRGLAFYWGTSEWSAERIAEANLIAQQLGLVGPVVEQPKYNLLWRHRVEAEYARLYERWGLGITNFSPLDMGILTGKYNDGIPAGSRFADSKDKFVKAAASKFGSGEVAEKIEKVKALTAVAASIGATMAQFSLAWCLANPHVSSLIIGASRPEQIEENVKALEFVDKITEDVRRQVDAIVPVGVLGRYAHDTQGLPQLFRN